MWYNKYIVSISDTCETFFSLTLPLEFKTTVPAVCVMARGTFSLVRLGVFLFHRTKAGIEKKGYRLLKCKIRGYIRLEKVTSPSEIFSHSILAPSPPPIQPKIFVTNCMVFVHHFLPFNPSYSIVEEFDLKGLWFDSRISYF